MTEEEIDNLQEGDIIVWDTEADAGRIECYMIYGGIKNSHRDLKFTTVLDLSTGEYATWEPGTEEHLLRGTLLNQCRILPQDTE